MADDITARIFIAVENADAVQKCAEIEKGLQKVTEARQDDVAAAKDQAQAAQKEAEAFDFSAEGHARHRKKLQEELEAAKALAKEQEKLGKSVKEYEKGISANEARRQMGMPELTNEEEEKLHQERLRRANEYNATLNAQKPTASASNSDEAAQQERAKRILDQRKENEEMLGNEVKKRTSVTEQALAKEIAQQNILIAKKRLQVAVEKELELLQRKKLVEQNLQTAQSTGNMAGVAGAKQALEQINRELIDARGNSLNAAAGVKAAEKAFEMVGDTTKHTARQANVLLRSLRAVGRAMGMPIAESPELGGGAAVGGGAMTMLAGVAAFTSVTKFFSELQAMNLEAYRHEQQQLDWERSDQWSTFENMKSAAAEQTLLFDSLKSYNSALDDSAVSQAKIAEVLDTLNKSLYDFRLEIDHTGRVTNLYTASVAAERGVLQQQLDAIRSQSQRIRQEQNELANLSDNSKRFKPGDVVALEWLGFKGAAKKLHDFHAQLEDAVKGKLGVDTNYQRILETPQRQRELRVEADRVAREERELRRKMLELEANAIQEMTMRIAELTDSLKKFKERIEESQNSVERHRNMGAWNVEFDEKIKNKIAELTKDVKSAEEAVAFWRKFKDARGPLFSKEQELNAMGDLARAMRELSKWEGLKAQREIAKINIERSLSDMNKHLGFTIKELKGYGKLAIEREKLALQREQLRIRQGYSEKEANEWYEIKLRELMLGEKMAGLQNATEFFGRIFGSIFKMRATAQNAVFANSIEAVHLQSRMMNSKSYQQQIVDIAKKQFETLRKIEINTANTIQGATV